MARKSKSRLVLAATAGAVAAAVPAGTPAYAEPVIRQPFSVVVDNCRSSYTEGTLGWELGPSIGQVVYVRGVVADDAAGTCAPTTRYTVATFRAYYGNRVLATQAVRADNAVVPVAVNLSATPTIDRVQVEVCRRDRAEVTAQVPPLVCTSRSYPRLPNAQ